MENTIKLVQKQHDVLVDVIQYLDSTKQSNTLIRSQVDTILNFEKKLTKLISSVSVFFHITKRLINMK